MTKYLDWLKHEVITEDHDKIKKDVKECLKEM